MTGDIPSLQPTTASVALLRAGLSPAQVLTLLQPMENLLPPGDTATAEVVTLKQLDQQFQLLLKLVMSNGNQTSVQVNSPLPFTPGTSLTVSQASPNALTLTLQQINSALNNTQTSLDIKQLPVGTLLQGRVLTTQVVADAVGQLAGQPAAQPNTPASLQPGTPLALQPALYRSIVILLNTAQAGTSLTIDSPRPLAVGTLLSAQVQGSQALSFVPLPNRLDQLAVSQQLTTQQSRQGSLDVLINALRSLPASSPEISAPLQASIDKLLADLPDIEQMTNPKTVAQAFNASGLFMEAKLLTGLNPMLAPDMKANLMRLIAQILPGLPDNPSYNAAAASNMLARTMPGVIRSALGTLGLVAPPLPLVQFPLPSRSVKGGGKGDDLEILLKLAAAAVSRLQSHQLGGLEQTRSTADGGQLTTWQLEVPMRNAHDIVPLQVKVQREDKPEKNKTSDKDDEAVEPREKLWKIELAFDLEPLGPLQVQAQLVRGSLSSQLWAERDDSAALISQELEHLRDRLVAAGLTVGELACRQGTPPQGPRTTLERRWIDENA
jgi:hypothetical protein